MKSLKHYSCPVCRSKETAFVLKARNSHGANVYDTKTEFEYWNCKVCSALFLVGQKANSSYYKKYYTKDYREEKTNSILSSYIISYSNIIKRDLVRKYTVADKGNRSILDIGSGDATFLKALSQHKFNRYGLEIDRNLTASYKKEGITPISNDILTHNFKKQKFDCITMWHVIEHIHNPQKLMQKVNSLLTKNGVFIFSTPNTDSIGFQKGKENWFHLDAPRHFILYSSSSLQRLAKNNGFGIVEKRNNWHDFPLDLFWSLHKTQSKYLYYFFYPYFKFVDNETVTQVWRKV